MVVPSDPPEILGIYLDLTAGDSLAGVRISILEATSRGRLVLRPAEGGPLNAMLNHLNHEELLLLLETVHCQDKRKTA